MVKDFIKQYGPPNTASKGCGLLKRKFIESPEGMKGHESQKKVAESTLGHYCLNEAQSRNKGKTIVIEAPNVPPLMPEARKAQTFIPLTVMPTSSHNQAIYPQGVNPVPPYNQATVG
ncbi:hypothetical protein KY289_013449 [Solanum tuberosum]|nr:hypothetical protein KY289_013449 [Solanum tuberosum]